MNGNSQLRIIALTISGVVLILIFAYVFQFSGLFIRTDDCRKAVTAMQQGNYLAAVELGERDIEKHPLSLHSYKVVGYSYLQLGNNKKAIQYLSKVIKLLPRDRNLLYYRQSAYYKNKQIDLAVADLSNIIDESPDDIEAYLFLSKYLLDQNKYDSARTVCDSALKFNRHDSRVWLNRGAACYGMQDFQTALICFDTSMYLSPGKRKAKDAKAMTLLLANDDLLAEDLLSELISLDYKPLLFRELRGELYMGLGQWEKAIGDYSVLINSNPYDIPFRLSRARSLMQNHDYLFAINDCQHILHLSVTVETDTVQYAYRGEAFTLLAWCYYKNGNADSSRFYNEQARALGYTKDNGLIDSLSHLN